MSQRKRTKKMVAYRVEGRSVEVDELADELSNGWILVQKRHNHSIKKWIAPGQVLGRWVETGGKSTGKMEHFKQGDLVAWNPGLHDPKYPKDEVKIGLFEAHGYTSTIIVGLEKVYVSNDHLYVPVEIEEVKDGTASDG